MPHRKTEIQSIIFDNSYWTARGAVAWMRKHGYKYDKMVIDTSEYRFKQTTPNKFSFFISRPIDNGTIKLMMGFYPAY